MKSFLKVLFVGLFYMLNCNLIIAAYGFKGKEQLKLIKEFTINDNVYSVWGKFISRKDLVRAAESFLIIKVLNKPNKKERILFKKKELWMHTKFIKIAEL